MIISKKPDKIKKDLEGVTLFALKAGLNFTDEKKVLAYVLLYNVSYENEVSYKVLCKKKEENIVLDEKIENIVILKKAKSPEILAKYAKEFSKKYNVSLEIGRKPCIHKFDASKNTIYMFAKMNRKELERFNQS